MTRVGTSEVLIIVFALLFDHQIQILSYNKTYTKKQLIDSIFIEYLQEIFSWVKDWNLE